MLDSTEIPVDPFTLAAVLDQHAVESDAAPDLDLDRPGLAPAGLVMVARTLMIHGRPHTVRVARIRSTRPAYLDR